MDNQDRVTPSSANSMRSPGIRLSPPPQPPRRPFPLPPRASPTLPGLSRERTRVLADEVEPKEFFVMITGRLESAQCPLSSNNLYCRYSFQHGQDWNITHGVSSGVTQMGRTSWGNGSRQSISFNFPIDISFQTSNVAGWPRIAIAVYGLDMFGRDVARGYASMLCPMTPGISIKHAQLFVPTSSNICQRMLNWMNGAMPEFYDSKFVAQGEGRAATIVERTGSVKLILDVATKQMRDFGYVTDDSHMTTK